jgi:WD40 repeat protein
VVSPTSCRNERTTRYVSKLYGLFVNANGLRRSSFDGTARLWDSVTGECLKVFADHKRPVYALDFSPNGQFLSTGSGDGWLYIYDVKVNKYITFRIVRS